MVVSFRGPLVGLLGALGGSLNIGLGDTTPGRQFGVSGSEFRGSSRDHDQMRPRQPLHDYRGLSIAATPGPPRA